MRGRRRRASVRGGPDEIAGAYAPWFSRRGRLRNLHRAAAAREQNVLRACCAQPVINELRQASGRGSAQAQQRCQARNHPGPRKHEEHEEARRRNKARVRPLRICVQARDRRAEMRGGVVPELRDARMAFERGLHDAALHAAAAAMDQPHLAQAGGSGGIDVLRARPKGCLAGRTRGDPARARSGCERGRRPCARLKPLRYTSGIGALSH